MQLDECPCSNYNYRSDTLGFVSYCINSIVYNKIYVYKYNISRKVGYFSFIVIPFRRLFYQLKNHDHYTFFVIKIQALGISYLRNIMLRTIRP